MIKKARARQSDQWIKVDIDVNNNDDSACNQVILIFIILLVPASFHFLSLYSFLDKVEIYFLPLPKTASKC